jgi:hypothetical protein
MGKLLDKYFPVEFRIIMRMGVGADWNCSSSFPFHWFLLEHGKVSPQPSLGVVVLDKTVPNIEFQEHQSLHWLLNNLKYTKSDGSPYDPATDFFGFFPGKNESYQVKDFSNLNVSEVGNIGEGQSAFLLCGYLWGL